MSKLPVDPYNRTYIVEPPLDNPDRAPLGGTGKDFVVTLSDNVETPGSDMMFLSRSGKWVPFTTTDLVTWGAITGDITEQADLMAMFAQYTPTTGYHSVAFSGNYNELNHLPPLGTVSPLDLDGSTSRFLRGDGTWAIPVDVNAQWGNISGNINAQTDLIALLNLKAPITSPVFQGNPQAPTPPVDDNSKSLATTEWFFGQAFNGVPQMDGVGSSGNSTLWARGNHRHPSDDTKIGDAPNDGKQYARQSQTWTVVSASGGGGGGGVWIGDLPPSDTTTYPFWWSSASLQLSIWYNDGNSSQWVDTNAQPNAPTGPWLLSDGTQAAPGLAWASEPGLGWYRYAANKRAFAVAGQTVELMDTDSASTAMSIFPRAPGGVTSYGMSDQPLGSANYHSLGIAVSNTQYNISGVAVGSATAIPLMMTFPAGITANCRTLTMVGISGADPLIAIQKASSGRGSYLFGTMAGSFRWSIGLGNAVAESGGNAGSDFEINNYNDAGTYTGTPMSIARSSGIAAFQQNLVACTAGPAGAAGQLGFAINTTEQSVYLYSSPAYRLGMNTANGVVFLQTNGVTRTSWTIDGAMGNNGPINATAFNPTSDERMKDRIAPLTVQHDEFMGIVPISYIWKDNEHDTKTHWGFSAQNLAVVAPRAYVKGDEYDAMDPVAIQAMTVLEVQDLITRVRALEAKL